MNPEEGHLRSAADPGVTRAFQKAPAARWGCEGGGAGPPAMAGGSPGPADGAAACPVPPIDSRLLKKSFAHLEPHSDKVMAYFYGNLFVHNPDFRAMFALAMDGQRRRLFDGLAHAVWSADQHPELTEYLCELARDHRKFGVRDEHYEPFCEALLASLDASSGWTEQTRDAWRAMLGHVARVMAAAARAAAATEPAWWLGEVAGHQRRGRDVAVITLRADGEQPLRYRAGQYISLQVPRYPRVWRCYSVANAPRPDGTLDLHIRALPGGRVSTLLVEHTRPGDTLLVGPARGTMTTVAVGSGHVLAVAGGTGLAPVKALVEELATRDAGRPEIHLLAAARAWDDLYDLADLRRLEASCASLTVTPVVPPRGGSEAARAAVPAAAAAALTPDTTDIFVSGPDGMVRSVTRRLAALAPGARIHTDSLRTWRADRRRPAPPEPAQQEPAQQPGGSRAGTGAAARPAAGPAPMTRQAAGGPTTSQVSCPVVDRAC